MGLLDELVSKKESTRARSAKSAPIKKVIEKSSRTAEKSASSQSTSNTFIDSLKRVQGALSPVSKTKSTTKQDVKRARPTSEVSVKSSEKIKDKDRNWPKDKDKEREKRSWFRSPSRSTVKKEIKSSTTSLNVGGSGQKVAQDSKKKRPLSAFPDNVTYRRGQTTKIEGHNLGDNLSRASSVTNIDVDAKSGKGARPRKSSSRDRLDKIGGDARKNDKKGITRNNNKLESEENPHYSVDTLSEEELLHLKKQLQDMAQEKTNLALQLGEHKGQLNILQKEIQKLKEESSIQLEHLTEENTTLRSRLRDVALSPLSDNEKQQLLFDSHRHHSSAPASIATNITDDGNGADTTCTTPDWDKHSSGNVSGVSVACLQDKINQMQETHYSTNEELQATLQELTDLQRQLTELQQENERLNEEKTLMFDSLCRQTERLNDSRSEVESLKQLLYQEKDDTGQFETAVEREQKLVDLLKSAQEEREGLLVKLEQLNNELQDTRSGIIEKDDQIGHLRERVKTLECILDAKHAEHKLLDQELAQAKDHCSGKQIEINRLTDLLDNARTKINELEQDRTLSDKSELDELLDNARKEKDSLESEVAHLKEQLAISKNEIEKLREQVSVLQEECKVTRNNAKTTQSDLEYKCEKLVKDKNVLNEQLQEFQEALNELQVQSQCQLEDKRQLSAVLSETQRNLSEAERKNLALENEVDELKRLRAEENEEWEKFQDDLLTSVRVANDFKTEAQQELQRMILENKSYRDRERQLKAEIEKLKGGTVNSVADKENMELLVKRPNRNKNKPRKDSGTLSGSSKSDKTQNSPQLQPVKRRENKSLKAKRLKTLSVEEEMLLTSLESYHADIDKNLPDDFLTEEQKVIKKLKIIYEDDHLKIKPVAPKPKDQLAISKPLLDSVLTNPKLMAILKNPKVKTVEDMATFEKEAPEIRNLIQDIDRSKKGQSDNLGRPEYSKRISIIGRSMSCDHVNEVDGTDGNLRLYRSPEAEDLTEEGSVGVRIREPSLVPSDSVSNYNRYSDFSLVINNKQVFQENVKYSTLERIIKTIPKNAPEAALTKEQKFALKLHQALEERKNTLKKSDKAKTLPISTPTPDSVLKNPKLKEIIYDPYMKDIRRKSEPMSPQLVEKILRQSKSYDNIIFNFEDQRHSVNVYHSTSESSSDTFSSAEFNVETGQTGPYEPINTWTKPAGTPKLPKKVVLTTFGQTSSEQTKKISHKSQLLKDELTRLTQPSIGKRGGKESVSKDKNEKIKNPVKQKSKHDVRDDLKKAIDSLVNNETANKKETTPSLDSGYKVDLLQEKIKKKTKKEPIPKDLKTESIHIERRPDDVDGKPEIKALDSAKVKIEDKIPTILQIEPTDSFPADETDSLTYNETLTRILKRETSIPKDSYEEQPEPSISADEAIKNITEKLEEIKKLMKEDEPAETINIVSINAPNDFEAEDIVEMRTHSKREKIEESVEETNQTEPDTNVDTKKKDFEVENKTLEALMVKTDDLFDKDTAFDDMIDGIPEHSPEYDYHEILKENRVGVTSPLNYRLSYKDVVKEIKKRFSDSDLEIGIEKPIEEIDTDVQVRTDSSIDKEMEEILENYLHTRVSQLIKQTEGKHSETTEMSVYTDFDKKLNDIVQSPFSHELEMFSQELPKTITPSPEVIDEKLSKGNIKPEVEHFSFHSKTELQFSDDSYFELQGGNVINVKAGGINITEHEEQNIKDVMEITKYFLEDQRKVPEIPVVNVPQKVEKILIPTNTVLDEQIEDFLALDEPDGDKNSSTITTELPIEKMYNKEEEELGKNTTVEPTNDSSVTNEVLKEQVEDLITTENPKEENASTVKNTEEEYVKIPTGIEKQLIISIPKLSEMQMFTDEELEVVRRSSKSQTFSRPLSEFNENDLEIFKAISANYQDENDYKEDEEKTNDENGPVKRLSNLNHTELELIEKLTKEYKDSLKEIISSTEIISEDTANVTPQMIVKEPIPKPRSKKEPDDLESLLTSFSSSRSRVTKRRIHSKVLPSTELIAEKTSECEESGKAKSLKDTISENNVNDLKNISSAEDNTVENNKEATESVKENSGTVVEDEVTVREVSVSESRKVQTDPSENRDGTLRKSREMHVILYRNNKTVDRQQQARSLVLPDETDSSNNDLNKIRLSLNLKTKVDEKKEKMVKSFAQHFERLSQERLKFAQKKSEKKLPEVPPTERKPVPTPRIKNQGTKNPVKDDSYPNDNYEVLRKMSECKENFSESMHKDACLALKIQEKGGTEVPSLHESQNLVVDDFNSMSTDEEENDVNSGEEHSRRKSDKYLSYLESDDTTDAAKSSFSVIAVAGTAEKLDLRNQSRLTIEPSSLNLFNLEASSLEENYMEKKNRFVSNYTDVDSSDDGLDPSDSKPKIVDFVPLDEATKPYYENNHMPDYSTLEREKTYQILNAVSKGKITDSKEDHAPSSRSSYSVAKKIFEDLEAKYDTAGVNKVTITKKKSKDILDNPEFSSTESTIFKMGMSSMKQEIDEI